MLAPIGYRSVHFSRRPMLRHARWLNNAAAGGESIVKRIPKLTLYTGTDCQLCEVVKEELQLVKESVPPFELALYNIRDDSLQDVQRWRRAYQYDIPVLHLDGQEIARHRIKRDDVADKIRRAAAQEAHE